MNPASLPESRALVLVAGEVCGPCLARELANRGEDPAGTSVVVIAPALVHSATRAWTDDIDAAIDDAERRADTSVALLRRQGYTVEGKVGDSNPVRAIQDALAEFPSGKVHVATHPVEWMEPLEKDLVDRVTRDDSIGVTPLVMAADGQYPLTSHESGYAPGRTAKSGPRADDRRAAAAEHG